jgi:hypothetical protein
MAWFIFCFLSVQRESHMKTILFVAAVSMFLTMPITFADQSKATKAGEAVGVGATGGSLAAGIHAHWRLTENEMYGGTSLSVGDGKLYQSGEFTAFEPASGKIAVSTIGGYSDLGGGTAVYHEEFDMKKINPKDVAKKAEVAHEAWKSTGATTTVTYYSEEELNENVRLLKVSGNLFKLAGVFGLVTSVPIADYLSGGKLSKMASSVCDAVKKDANAAMEYLKPKSASATVNAAK